MNRNEKLLKTLEDSIKNGTLKKAILSKPCIKDIIKITAKPIKIKNEKYIQLEKHMTDGKALHENISAEIASEKIYSEFVDNFSQLNIFDIGGQAEAKKNRKGDIYFKSSVVLSENTVDLAENNREKNYIFLNGTKYDFLTLLGVSDENGRVYDKKYSKFRQINRFVEIVKDALPTLENKDEICIWDLCCGKSYLTFAVYYYFTYVLNKNVTVYGIDLKKDVIEYCTSCAEKLGWNKLHFICGDIMSDIVEETPDMIISLHACDIATDVVLAKAVKLGTKVILSSPCCQHELYSQLKSSQLSFITDYPMLKKKLCETVTDALRCELLSAFGYKVTTLEFIDPEDTPKNLLIRAQKQKGINADKIEKYKQHCKNMSLYPSLAKFLNIEI